MTEKINTEHSSMQEVKFKTMYMNNIFRLNSKKLSNFLEELKFILN